jgi:hypothetical protein
MRVKICLGITLVAVLIWAIAAAIRAHHQAVERKGLELAKAQRAAELARLNQTQPAPPGFEPVTVAPAPEPAAPQVAEQSPAKAAASSVIKKQKVTRANQPKPKEPIQDPDAREALSLVGTDPAAEAYWYLAINDPNLPAPERSDLIEDLNEDGISDPKHPTADDLPVIMRRIELIEGLGPEAMDKVNADAFEEAYKDLVNLARLASGNGGEPVK